MMQDTIKMPQNEVAEKVALSALSTNYESWERHSWSRDLFHLPNHRTIYTLMEQAMQCGHPVDVMAITSLAIEKNLLDACGGAYELNETLTQLMGTVDVALEGYHRQLAECHLKRETIRLLNDSLPSVVNGDLSVSDLQEKFANLPISRETFLSKLEDRRVTLDHPPIRPEPLFSVNGITICTHGNLTVISAQAKAGKSALLTAFMASAINPETECDTLGLTAENPEEKTILHFDTEQSEYDLFSLIQRALRRAELNAIPPIFSSYRMVGLSVEERRKMLETALYRASKKKAIHSVFLDGVADFVKDPNDAEECFAYTDILHALAIKYQCAIILVLHENPAMKGSESKTRGHLGSQLERKAETTLRLEKSDEVTTYYAKLYRHAPILKADGIRFAWNGEAQMHTTVNDAPQQSKSERAKAEHGEILNAIFEDVSTGFHSYGSLKDRLESLGIKGRTAERRIRTFVDMNLITKTECGYSLIA